MYINQQKKSFFNKKRIILSSIIVLLLIIGGAFLYGKSLLEPVEKDSKTTVNINIPSGSSVSAIASILKKNDVIKN